MDRIRISNYRGYQIELWRVYSVHGKLRVAKAKHFAKPTYNYKVLTPERKYIAGKHFQPHWRWKTKEKILDGLIEMIEKEKTG